MGESHPFQLLIKPVGGDCNLRCDYCFYLRALELYPDEKRHQMPDDVLETIVRGLMEQRFPVSVFAWQGGEPTLAGLEFFQRAVALQRQFALPGQQVANALQTNGSLLDEAWCRLFRQHNFLIGLSIDGPEDIHNQYRKNIGGRGMWSSAMAAAELMTRTGVEFNILCVVNDANVSMGADLLRWFVDRGFQYLQFIPCVEKGGKHNVPVEAYGEFLCDTFDYWAREGMGRVSIRDFDAMLTTRAGLPGGMCVYGDRCNGYIVIEHNGDVYPCDFFVYGDWKLGNVKDRPLPEFLQLDRFKQFAFQKNKVPACRGCRWRSMCHGGCPKDRLATGSVHDPSALCAAYMRFFDHASPRLTALAKRVLASRQ
ncbi:MAG: anaerobic sulfatase maturase [Candidatus Hydrogenedentota bacterium]